MGKKIWLAGSLALLLAAGVGVATRTRNGESAIPLPAATSSTAKISQPYEFQVGHCGLLHVVSFDGDYWDVDPSTMTDEENQRFGINSDTGTITLKTYGVAVYRSSSGGEATLHRHAGQKTTFLCG
jgi:hypothetical protein